MKHFANPDFWYHYRHLTAEIRARADKQFALFGRNPRHPSLRLKKVGDYWSVRISANFRAVAIECEGGLLWIWIGAHSEYERVIRL